MRKDREQAIVLRQAGMTYSDIKERMGVPLATLSNWFKGQNWSNDIATANAKKSRNSGGIRFAVLNTVRGTRLRKIYEDARQDALVDFDELKYHPLFLSGVMLYWSHGDKTSARVTMTTGDWQKARIFRSFLLNVCGAKNIRVQLAIPEEKGSDDSKYREYWSKAAGIDGESYQKTMYIRRKKLSNRPYYGICNMIVNSAYLKNKILRWIELLAEDIGQEKYIVDNAGIV